MPFRKGIEKVKASGRKKGTTNKRTLIREQLGLKSLEDLKDKVLSNWFEFINDTNKEYRIIATKEISKYLWAVKKDAGIGLNETELEILRQAAAEQMKKNV